MIVTVTPAIHPGVPIALHPGVDRPPFAAGREALTALYRCYMLAEASKRHQELASLRDELAVAVDVVERCLAELRSLHDVLAAGSNRSDLAAIQRTITRVESGVHLLTRRCARAGAK